MKKASESVNRFWLALMALAAIGVTGVVFGGSAGAAEADPLAGAGKVDMEYSVFLGGLHIMDSTAHFTRSKGRYRLEMKAFTLGLFNMLAPWDATLISGGRLEGERVHPLLGTVTTHWRDDTKEVRLEFEESGKVSARFVPPDDDKHEKVPQDMLKGVLDPLSGVVQVMASLAYGKGCEQTVPLFDGHRRFDVILREAGDAMLESKGYAVFDGAAARCEAILTMRAGSRRDREGSRFWEDEKGQKTRPPVYIYLADIHDDLPPMPVRVETRTPFGSVMIHLKGLRTNSLERHAEK